MAKKDKAKSGKSSQPKVAAAAADPGSIKTEPDAPLAMPIDRRAERVAKRQAAEAGMSDEEIRAAKRARGAERRARIAAMPPEAQAKKEAELANAREARLAAKNKF